MLADTNMTNTLEELWRNEKLQTFLKQMKKKTENLIKEKESRTKENVKKNQIEIS